MIIELLPTYVIGVILPEVQVECALLLDVALAQRSIVVQRLAVQDQHLVMRRNGLLVLNFALHAGHRVIRVDPQREGTTSFRFDEDRNFGVRQLLLFLLLVCGGEDLWMLVAHRLRQGERAGVLQWGSVLHVSAYQCVLRATIYKHNWAAGGGRMGRESG